MSQIVLPEIGYLNKTSTLKAKATAEGTQGHRHKTKATVARTKHAMQPTVVHSQTFPNKVQALRFLVHQISWVSE